MKLPITKPYFDEHERELMLKPLETGWVVQGPYVKEFEENIAAYTGAKHAIAVNSCTSGQFILSQILGLKPGDEVIVPSFTWISTINSIEYLGAKAIFCDVDIDTFNLDPEKIEALITDKTVAIYPVALFGLPADMISIMNLAKKYGLRVIEDCACGLGGWIDETHCGLFGDAGVFSFHPRKSITTGEGGMIITNDDHIAKMAASLRDHGAIKTDFERHHDKGSFLLTEYHQLGYNMRMTDMQGAMGVAQSNKLRWIMDRKKVLAKRFANELEHIPYLKAPLIPENYIHGFQAYCTLFMPDETIEAIKNKDLNRLNELNEKRNTFMASLEEQGISTRQGTHAVHIQKLYKEKYSFNEMDYPASYAADKLTVALPFYPTMQEEEIEYLFSHLKRYKG